MAARDAGEHDPAVLAQEIATFVAEEKLKAHNRMRMCESFLMRMRSPLDDREDEKEALTSLARNAEDDYGTLLHLERILNMKANAAFRKAQSLCAEAKAASVSTKQKNGASSLDDFHQAQGFVMGAKSDSPTGDLDGDFDPYSLSPARKDKENELEDSNGDEDDKVCVIPNFKTRNLHGAGKEEVARSLPMSIPLPPEKTAGRKIDLPSDDEDGAVDGKNIHRKMAEIAKSMYEDSIFPSSPNERFDRDT